jgi:hypothetical protein
MAYFYVTHVCLLQIHRLGHEAVHTPLHLVPSLRLHGTIPPTPHTPSLCDVQRGQDFTLTLRVATTYMPTVNKMKANKTPTKH